MDILVHVETQGLAQPYFNLMDTKSYVSPDVWEALGYAMYDNQSCNYLVILPMYHDLAKSNVTVIQV